MVSAADVVVFIKGNAGNGDLMVIPLTGGTPRLVASAVAADSIATDGVDVYWTDHAQMAIMKCNLTSGQPRTLAPYVGAETGAAAILGGSTLALDATILYYVSGAADSRIHSSHSLIEAGSLLGHTPHGRAADETRVDAVEALRRPWDLLGA